jgi:hypothetical protein
MNNVPMTRTVDQAIAEASTEPNQAGPYSCFQFRYPDKDGKDTRTPWRHNLTTTAAVGYTNANDWLAKLMGQGSQATFATAQGNATSTGATTLTNTGASFPTSGQALQGCIVIAGPNTSGAGSFVWGVIVSNTATALTVDQWYSWTSTTGAAGATPNATASYGIWFGQSPAMWLAVTANVFTPANTDTTLAGELTSNGFTRAIGTYSHSAAASTYQLVHLWTSTGGTTTVNNEAQFGAANTTGGGVMPFESAEPSPPTLVSGDTLQNTITITI